MKKKFLNSLPSDWVKYLIVVLISVVLWMWAFGAYHAPKKTEKLEIFFAGSMKNYAVESLAAEALEGVKKVSVSSENPRTGVTFEQKYTYVAATTSDVVIVPKEVATETDCEHSFEILTGTFDNPYEVGGVQYGVYLSEERKAALSEYFDFEYDEYVVFAVASSVNSGQLTNHSFELIEWLVG